MSYSYFMLGLLFCICIISSFTDIKWGKIYNRYLLWSLIVGSVAVFFYYVQNKELIRGFIFNLIMAGLLSILFFKYKIWGAGDSKLWLVICYLFPYGRYLTNDYLLFPAFYILFFIFLVTYLYVLGETLVFYIGRRHSKKNALESKNYIINKQILVDSIFYFVLLKIFYQICNVVFQNYYISNFYFFVLVGLFLITAVMRMNIKKIFKILVIIIGTVFYLTNFNGYYWTKINVITIIISIVIVCTRKEMSKYNYDVVLVKNVKKGMIMAIGTVIEFNKSRVKGLPQYTDESTKYRINEEEVQAIKRWEKSKQGKGSIVIVKYLPFAIFMCLGLIIYMIWSGELHG